MIIGAIIDLITGVLGFVFDLLPQSSLGILSLGSYSATLTNVGYRMGSFNTFVPVVFILSTLTTVMSVVLPAVIVYKVANWTWKHIPNIAGFGPGGG